MIQDNTNISLKTPQGSNCIDNIWLSADAKALATGKISFCVSALNLIVSAVLIEHSGVIRDNLTNVWIPAGWTWGGLVSDHCPIWIEFDLK